MSSNSHEINNLSGIQNTQEDALNTERLDTTKDTKKYILSKLNSLNKRHTKRQVLEYDAKLKLKNLCYTATKLKNGLILIFNSTFLF